VKTAIEAVNFSSRVLSLTTTVEHYGERVGTLTIGA
jgi:hypothetical protein